MAALSLKNLVKTFTPDVTAVDGLSLDVADGELVVLFGPSGCGKTTTLRMVAGLENVTSGSISIDNKNVVSAKTPPNKRNVAMVFQNQALYPRLNVFDNMAFGLKMRAAPRPEIKKRVEEAAGLLGLLPLLERRPRELSGGQQQRVALGRALVRSASVYLMDEPLSSLDGPLRDHLRREIRRLQVRHKMTMLWVTHQPEEAMAVADRIVVLHDGVVQQIDRPAAIYATPASRRIAALIGRPGINFLPAVLKKNGRRIDVHGDGFTLPDVGSIYPKLATSKLMDKLMDHDGQKVFIGVRPEEVLLASPSQQASPGRFVIRGTIETIEHLGPECLVCVALENGSVFETSENSPLSTLRLGNAELFVVRAPFKLPPAALQGERATLSINANRLLFFDQETGRALC